MSHYIHSLNSYISIVTSLNFRTIFFAVVALALSQQACAQSSTPNTTKLSETNQQVIAEMVSNSISLIPEQLDLTSAENRTLLRELFASADMDAETAKAFEATMTLAEKTAGRPMGKQYLPSITNINEDEEQSFVWGPVTSVIDIQPDKGSKTVSVAGLVSMPLPPRTCFGLIGLSPDMTFSNINFSIVTRHNGCANLELHTSGSGDEFDPLFRGEVNAGALAVSVVEYPDGTVSALYDGLSTSVGSNLVVNSTNPPETTPSGKIKVCVWRGDADCNYTFANPQQTLAITLDGSAKLTNPLVSFDRSFAAYVSALVQKKGAVSGGGCYLYDIEMLLGSGLTITYDATDKELNWLVDNITMSIPNDCLADQNLLDYFFKLTVKTKGTPLSGLEDIYVATPNYLTSPPNLTLPDFVVNWGCITGDSLITMADGSSRPISSIRAGDKIMTGNRYRKSATVSELTTGTEPYPILIVETDAGNVLRMTREHPVPVLKNSVNSGQEFVFALDLKVTDTIFGISGQERIVSITEGKRNLPVYNLKIANEPQQGRLKSNGSTFIANGIVVGDYDQQGALVLQNREKKVAMFSR